MSDRTPATPTPSGDADRRVREALHAYADTVEPGDAWPTIVDRLDRRSGTWAWVTRHPLAIGAVAAVLVLVVALGVAALTGGDGQDLDVAPVVDEGPADGSLVAVTADARVVALDAAGAELASPGELPTNGGLPLGSPDLAVVAGADGPALAYLHATAPDEGCPASTQVVTDLALAPLDGTSDASSPWGRGSVQVTALSGSPTGDRLAIVRQPGDDCAPGAALIEIRDAASGAVVGTIVPEPGMVVHQLVWLSDGRLVALVQRDADVSFLVPVVIEDPAAASELPAPEGIPLPMDVVAAPAPAGQVWLVGHLDDTPLDQESELSDRSAGLVLVRGELTTGQVVQRMELADSEMATVLSVAGLGDQAYVALAPSDEVEAGSAGVGLSGPPYGGRLLRVGAAGTDELRQDVVALVARPASAASEPGSGPGPVVGARADGSVARLDPATGEVVGDLWVDEDFPAEARAAGRDQRSTEEVLRELSIDPASGRVIQARPGAGTECPDDELVADWDLWVDAEDGAPTPVLGEPATLDRPSRLPAVSPDGSHLAFVSSSDGTRCDGALVVVVVDLATGAEVATHSLPVGIVPAQLVWPTVDQLLVALPLGTDGPTPPIQVVAVDPLATGPLSLEGVEVLGGVPRLGDATEGVWLASFLGRRAGDPPATSGDPTPLTVAQLVPFDGAGLGSAEADPAAEFTLPVREGEGAALSVAQDGTETVWTTVGLGTPTWPLVDWDGTRTYRWRPGDTEPTAVADGFLAVVAVPEPGAGPDAAPPTSPPPSAPTDDAARPGVVWVTADGAVEGLRPGGDGGVEALGAIGDGLVPRQGHQATVTPDGRTLVVTLSGGSGVFCDGRLATLSLEDGTAGDLGPGHSPAFAADGRLAYVEPGPGSDGIACSATLVVVDPDTGQERRWVDEAPGLVAIPTIVWAPDGSRLAYQRGGDVVVLDPDDASGVLPAQPAALPTPPAGDTWELVGWSAADEPTGGRLLVRAVCAAATCDAQDEVVALSDEGGTWVASDGDGIVASIPAETVVASMQAPDQMLRLVGTTCAAVGLVCDDPGYDLVAGPPGSEQPLVDDASARAATWWPSPT